MSQIKVFNTPNIKEQNFLDFYEWDLISHPKFPIPNLAFYNPHQSTHFKNHLQTVMNPDEFNLSFFGSGDYHYLTLCILELKRNPFYLIMFDNHWDLGNQGIKTNWFTKKFNILSKDDEIDYDCASWLWPATILRNCKGVLHLGQNQSFIPSFAHLGLDVGRHVIPEGMRYTIEDRFAGIPRIVKDYNFRYLKTDFSKVDDILDNNVPEHIDIYITIDKDVLSTDVLTCDYGQGKMTEETMFELLEKIKKKFGDRIIGVDSCGEPTCGFSGAGFKAHPEELGTPGYIRKMKPLIAPHNKINDRLCELFYKK